MKIFILQKIMQIPFSAHKGEIHNFDNNQPYFAAIAMRVLRQNNWVEEHDIKKDGKGRPMKVLESIIQHYEEESNRVSTRAMESIQRLKELTTV
jgi:predicted transcriptional regulator